MSMKMRPKSSASMIPQLSRTKGFLRKVISEHRTRQLQVASGGRYKYLIVSKIVDFLKTEYLNVREVRPTLGQLLEKVNEFCVSDAVKKWLAEDALPNYPRIRVVKSRVKDREDRYAYEAPLKGCSTEAGLLATLKKMHEKNEGGLLRSLVQDSVPLSDIFITRLLKEKKIYVIDRLDKNQVLFYKPHQPELDNCIADKRFVELWRKVDVGNKEISHIKKYLTNLKLTVFDEDRAIDNQSRNKRKTDEEADIVPSMPKRVRRSRRLKDNAHVRDELMSFD